MKTIKNKQKSDSDTDTDKALAKAGSIGEKKGKVEKQMDVFSDSIRAEKDEVKEAEERMRQMSNKTKNSNK